MNNSQIFQPFFAMMLVTFAVWVYMYLRRTSYLLGEGVDLRKVDTPAKTKFFRQGLEVFSLRSIADDDEMSVRSRLPNDGGCTQK